MSMAKIQKIQENINSIILINILISIQHTLKGIHKKRSFLTENIVEVIKCSYNFFSFNCSEIRLQ